jgi:SAM-dependent methyltransferase
VDKIEIIEKSLFALDFPDESFDIIWAEGSISAIGFEEDLKQWRRFLKLHGFLVIHDNISDITKMLKLNKYTQLRLFLKGDEEEDAWLVLEGSKGLDGLTSTESLEIPSSATSGIKLNRPFEIVAGMITKLTIDFDAKKSVIQKKKSFLRAQVQFLEQYLIMTAKIQN